MNTKHCPVPKHLTWKLERRRQPSRLLSSRLALMDLLSSNTEQATVTEADTHTVGQEQD